MKIMKTIRLSLLAAASLLLATAVRAQIAIHIAGAVSLKDITYNTLKTNMFGPANITAQNLDNSAKPTAANVYTIQGTMPNLFGSQMVTVYVNWNGSGAAIQSLTGNGTCNFFSSATQGVTNLVAANADVSFAVVFQSDYAYPTPVLNDSTYGCTPTIFVRSVNTPSSLTNLTSQHLRYLEANGSAPLSLFTGNASDTADIKWIMRDISAAHRIISAKEAGFIGSALGYAWDYTANGWTSDTVGQTTWPIIDKMLTNSSVGACITFLPPTEAGSVPAANILSFNGFLPFRGSFNTVSNDYSPTINGQYTCWGFEHIMTKPTADANIIAFANSFKTNLANNLLAGSPYSISLGKMNVTRSSTGGAVTPR
jgi:hypothetical protein